VLFHKQASFGKEMEPLQSALVRITSAELPQRLH